MRRALIVVAVLVVALVAAYLLVSNRKEAPEGEWSKEGAIGRTPGAAASGAEGKPAEEPRSKRKGDGDVRRLKSLPERARLVAMIENARRARTAGRAGGTGGEGDTDADGAEGALSKSIIQEGVRAVIGDIKACYEDALKRTPNLEGKLVARFEIEGEPDAGGVIDHAEIDDATDSVLRGEAELTGCIIDSIYTIELPRPENGGRVTVEYPFYLSPGSDEKR